MNYVMQLWKINSKQHIVKLPEQLLPRINLIG